MSYFLMHSDDATKSLVFGNHTDLWKKIEPKVQEWTLANWHKWEVEKPDWFTDNFKESVPNHFIPKTALEELHKKGGGGETTEQRLRGDGRSSLDETGRRERGWS